VRRIVAALTLALALAVGSVAYQTVDPEPAEAHAVSSAYSLQLCNLLRQSMTPLYDDFGHAAWRTIHFGPDHVTQCRITSGLLTVCYQYIWGIPQIYVYYVGTHKNCW
jgi:hypothetical protein